MEDGVPILSRARRKQTKQTKSKTEVAGASAVEGTFIFLPLGFLFFPPLNLAGRVPVEWAASIKTDSADV